MKKRIINVVINILLVLIMIVSFIHGFSVGMEWHRIVAVFISATIFGIGIAKLSRIV